MNSDYWYVFFVRTGQEQKAADQIKTAFEVDEVTHLKFLSETLFRKSGYVTKEVKLMFPGYVFIATKIRNDEFVGRSLDCVHKSKYIVKLLCYDDTHQAAMSSEEQAALDWLVQDNHCIEVSKGFIIGDRVIVTDGPLVGRESIIKGIDRHKMKAVIELEFMGGVRQMKVSLEIVERV